MISYTSPSSDDNEADDGEEEPTGGDLPLATLRQGVSKGARKQQEHRQSQKKRPRLTTRERRVRSLE